MRIVSVRFENYSIHISTAGVHKSQAILLGTVANNTCGRRLSMEPTSYRFTGGDNYDVTFIVV